MTSSSELLNVEPLELKFPFELKKQISCSIQVANKTESHVAFKVKTTNPKKYCVRPNTGVVQPRSTCDIVVTMQAQKEAPADMQCRDKFLLQSVVTSSESSAKDITAEMFNKEPGRVVEECKLRVLYVAPPQPPSPVAEGSEEGSPRTSSKLENGTDVARMFLDSHDKSPEVRSVVARLNDEKAAAVQRSIKLRQELELLKHGGSKSGGGVSMTVVLVIGLMGIILGYFFRRS